MITVNMRMRMRKIMNGECVVLLGPSSLVYFLNTISLKNGQSKLGNKSRDQSVCFTGVLFLNLFRNVLYIFFRRHFVYSGYPFLRYSITGVCFINYNIVPVDIFAQNVFENVFAFMHACAFRNLWF